MAKNLKINIKNTQIAQAINLTGVKDKLAKKKQEATDTSAAEAAANAKEDKLPKDDQPKEEPPRIRARSKSVFAPQKNLEGGEGEMHPAEETLAPASIPEAPAEEIKVAEEAPIEEEKSKKHPAKAKEEKTENIPPAETKEPVSIVSEPAVQVKKDEPAPERTQEKVESAEKFHKTDKPTQQPQQISETRPRPPIQQPTQDYRHRSQPSQGQESRPRPSYPTQDSRNRPPYHGHDTRNRPPHSQEGGWQRPQERRDRPFQPQEQRNRPGGPDEPRQAPYEKLGPTGRHIKDILPPRGTPRNQPGRELPTELSPEKALAAENRGLESKGKSKGRRDAEEESSQEDAKKSKGAKVKEFRDLKPARKTESDRGFDARDRQGLRDTEDEHRGWRKKRPTKFKEIEEVIPDRPTHLAVRTPISIKDLAAEMKLKASQLIAKLFLQGIVVTLNDLLEDETTIQLLGHEFGCEITIDTSEERRIRVTEHTVKEEIGQSPADQLQIRPPVVAFMGHVDHGKTSLIDFIRNSNRAAGEAGAITQHIGAFRCQTPVGDIAILDTPGHEAFSAMRARGADVTDIVVLVVAGDEGIRQQTVEAINHAKAANVTMVVAINKSDKPNFNPELVYRQLADNELLPEAWGGQTITVNCSAVNGAGIQNLLEMLALQAEVLELKANPHGRARGRVLESEMHKGLGSVATVLVQNGTLRKNDSLVFGQHWGRVKTMRDEFGRELEEATPSTPVQITGLSGLPEAGQEFIVVKSEKEARDIAEARMQGQRQLVMQQKKKLSMDNLVQQASEGTKKILNVILRADVQGSLEALRTAMMKIQSQKVEPNIIFSGVGEVSESDVQLAVTSKAVIIGFHTQIESHAENLQKQFGVQIRMHDIIYHAIDDVKALMKALLDKIPQENEKGKAEVKATFKSSHHGVIAGCQVIEGSIIRSNPVRLRRGKDVVWKGQISSLKRVKEDVREVTKGLECGILLTNFNDSQPGDIIESYEITYFTQEL